MNLKRKRRTIAKRDRFNDPFYQSREWRQKRKQILERDGYLCQCDECAKRSLPLTANTVDHIVPIKRGGSKLGDHNLQSMNSSCHQKKSAKEVRR